MYEQHPSGKMQQSQCWLLHQDRSCQQRADEGTSTGISRHMVPVTPPLIQPGDWLLGSGLLEENNRKCKQQVHQLSSPQLTQGIAAAQAACGWLRRRRISASNRTG